MKQISGTVSRRGINSGLTAVVRGSDGMPLEEWGRFATRRG